MEYFLWNIQNTLRILLLLWFWILFLKYSKYVFGILQKKYFTQVCFYLTKNRNWKILIVIDNFKILNLFLKIRIYLFLTSVYFQNYKCVAIKCNLELFLAPVKYFILVWNWQQYKFSGVKYLKFYFRNINHH